LSDISEADLVFVIGSNTTEAYPIVGIKIKKAMANGAVLITADPRQIELAAKADHWLRLSAGTNVALINGMLNVIIEEDLLDTEFIQSRTENFELTKAIVAMYTPEIVEEITGVPADNIRAAARAYAKAERAIIIYGLGVTEHHAGMHGVMSLANLAMATGNVGKQGAGIIVLRGQNNVQGSCDVGALPEFYTGFQRVSDAENRVKFSEHWGVDLPSTPGLQEVEMYNAAIQGKLKGLYVIGYNPAKTQSNLNFVHEAYDKTDFVVVQDIFMTETAKRANVILPAACYFEKDGTITTAERRIQRVRKVIEPPEGLRSDWEIVCMIAQAMGADLNYESASEIMDEIAALTPQYNGVSYERLETEELHWPVWDKAHEGTPLLHHTNFTKGLGTFHDIPYTPSVELPNMDYPLLLTTGRVLYHYCSGSMTQRTAIADVAPEETVEVHPEDADKYGLTDGEYAIVESKRGGVEVKVNVTERSHPGSVFLSFHFDNTLTNLITGPGEDLMKLTPEYKVCAVRLIPKTN
jgi:formate dehydrogenase alpha subunit